METKNQVCGNCKKEIASINFILHTIHCDRFLSVCPICNEPVPKLQFEEHQETCKTDTLNPEPESNSIVKETESPQAVNKSTAEKESLENVQQRLLSTVVETIRPSRSCPESLPTCRYCYLGLLEEALKEHEYYCGARTDICEGCGKRVILKNFDIHISTDCTAWQEHKQQNPQPSTSTVNPTPNGQVRSKRSKKCKKNKKQKA